VSDVDYNAPYVPGMEDLIIPQEALDLRGHNGVRVNKAIARQDEARRQRAFRRQQVVVVLKKGYKFKMTLIFVFL